VAIIVDRVAFGQRLGWLQIVGAALILLAAAGTTLGWELTPRERAALE
jgi:drug/metabolite transporter (DMT)-like permease